VLEQVNFVGFVTWFPAGAEVVIMGNVGYILCLTHPETSETHYQTNHRTVKPDACRLATTLIARKIFLAWTTALLPNDIDIVKGKRNYLPPLYRTDYRHTVETAVYRR